MVQTPPEKPADDFADVADASVQAGIADETAAYDTAIDADDEADEA